MYLRLMNELDVNILEDELQDKVSSTVINRIREQIEILDGAYGSRRGSKDMGGYILFFDSKSSYENSVNNIMQFYRLDSDLYEYSDCISEEDSMCWKEELYLLSSDDALVLIHPDDIVVG